MTVPSDFKRFPGGSAGKESACNMGDLGSIHGLGRSPGEGNDYPLQYSGLENSMDYIVHGVTKSRTRLSDFHFHSDFKLSMSAFKSIRPCISHYKLRMTFNDLHKGCNCSPLTLTAFPCNEHVLKSYNKKFTQIT